MSEEPEPDRELDLTGPRGETIFWSLKAWLIAKHENALQEHLDEAWKHYKDVLDHRLLALVAALCIEKSIDSLLLAFAPGFKKYEEDLDFTFSIKIKIARSMCLLPARILAACDLIRQIRNEFAHHLDYEDFNQLDKKKFHNKLLSYVQAFSKLERDPADYKRLFTDLTGFTLVSLRAYTEQLKQFRKYLMTAESQESFKEWSQGTKR